MTASDRSITAVHNPEILPVLFAVIPLRPRKYFAPTPTRGTFCECSLKQNGNETIKTVNRWSKNLSYSDYTAHFECTSGTARTRTTSRSNGRNTASTRSTKVKQQHPLPENCKSGIIRSTEPRNTACARRIRSTYHNSAAARSTCNILP